MRQYKRARVTQSAILFIIVASLLNVIVADEEISNDEPESTTDGPTTSTTANPPTTSTFATISSFSQNRDDGFKPSFEFAQINHPNHQSHPSKVKRQEAVVQLFGGASSNSSSQYFVKDVAGRNGARASEPVKATRGYYDESVHYRDYGPSSAYGSMNFPKIPQEDARANEVEIVHHHAPTRFQQDSIIGDVDDGGQFRSSPAKYHQHEIESPPSKYRGTYLHAPGGGGAHPYAYDNGGHSYYAPAPVSNGNVGQGLGLSTLAHALDLALHHTRSPHKSATPPVHHSEHFSDHSIRQSQSNSEIGFSIGPGVGKALKLLIPSALLLTGVSALFPNRVYVPTEPKSLRQKRGADYVPVNTDENIEYIPANLLRREHRTGDDEPQLYDYDDGTPNPYYGSYVSPRKSKVQVIKPTVVTVRSPQNTKSAVPEFVPIAGSVDDPLVPFEFTDPENVYDAFQFRNSQKQQKEEQIHAKNQNMKSGLTRLVPSILPSTGSFQRQTTGSGNLMNPSTTMLTKVTSSSSTTSTSPTGATRAINVSTTNALSTPNKEALTGPTGPKRLMRKRVKPSPEALDPPTSLVLPLSTSTSATLNPSKTPDLDDVKGEAFLISASTNHPPEDLFQKNKKSINLSSKQQELVKVDDAAAGKKDTLKFDLSPTGPVMGLLSAAVEHRQDSDVCQRRALCELALRGTAPKATKFETFLWALANLVPNAFTAMYDIDDIFQAIRDKNCQKYNCANPNLDIQE